MSERTAYLAPPDLFEQLRSELQRVERQSGDLIVTRGAPQPTVWAQNIWYDPQEIPIVSIADGAKKLRAVQRNWAYTPCAFQGRAKLIQEALPHVSAKPLVFPNPAPSAPLGSWTLLEPGLMLAASRCSSPFPNGIVSFEENHTDPPSRAYLKLWEAFTRFGVMPKKGERCLDAGAAPGGWTWVLAELGTDVTAVDRSEIVEELRKRKNVRMEVGDAFQRTPERGESYGWIFCDMACYPEKLLPWAQAWAESGCVERMICTVKFQGTGRYDSIPAFRDLPGSELVHLFHNKHELTWFFDRGRATE